MASMKTIYLQVRQTMEEMEVEDVFFGGPGKVVVQLNSSHGGFSGSIEIDVSQIDGGEFKPAPVVLQGFVVDVATDSPPLT